MTDQPIIPRPAFSRIDLLQIEAELDRHLAHCRETLTAAADARPASWSNVMQPQEEAHNATRSVLVTDQPPSQRDEHR